MERGVARSIVFSPSSQNDHAHRPSPTPPRTLSLPMFFIPPPRARPLLVKYDPEKPRDHNEEEEKDQGQGRKEVQSKKYKGQSKEKERSSLSI